MFFLLSLILHFRIKKILENMTESESAASVSRLVSQARQALQAMDTVEDERLLKVSGVSKLRRFLSKEYKQVSSLSHTSCCPSSNIPYLCGIWQQLLVEWARAPGSVRGVLRQFASGRGERRQSVLVDLVCDGGARWLRVKSSNAYSLQADCQGTLLSKSIPALVTRRTTTTASEDDAEYWRAMRQFVQDRRRKKNLLTVAAKLRLAARANEFLFQAPVVQLVFDNGVTSDLARLLTDYLGVLIDEERTCMIEVGRDVALTDDCGLIDDTLDLAEAEEEEEEEAVVVEGEDDMALDELFFDLDQLDRDGTDVKDVCVTLPGEEHGDQDEEEEEEDDEEESSTATEDEPEEAKHEEKDEMKTGTTMTSTTQKRAEIIPDGMFHLSGQDCAMVAYIERTGRVNVDVRTIISMISDLTHGYRTDLSFDSVLSSMSAAEDKEPLLPFFQFVLAREDILGSEGGEGGVEMVCCLTAWRQFEKIAALMTGERERQRIERLKKILCLFDDECEAMKDDAKCRAKFDDLRGKSVRNGANLAVFKTGEHLKLVTLTANGSFVRAAKSQGCFVNALVHPVRALTEVYQDRDCSFRKEFRAANKALSWDCKEN